MKKKIMNPLQSLPSKKTCELTDDEIITWWNETFPKEPSPAKGIKVMREVYNFWRSVTFLSENKVNLQFKQPG